MELATRSEATLARLADVGERARGYVHSGKAPNTWRAYAADWRHFTDWCAAHGVDALPASAETVGLYLTALAETHKPSTIQRRLTAISQAHQAAGHTSPTKTATVHAVWRGIRREKGVAQAAKKPVVVADLRAMVELLGDSLMDTRDRALLLLGFAAALRRSELVGLDVQDVGLTADGLVVHLRRSKTDQEGEGRKVGVPYGSNPSTCPVRAVQAWLNASGLASGPLFRPINRHGQINAARLSAQAVADVVKRRAEAAGFDPSEYAGHSLRAGLATSAAQRGVSERAIMAQTGHKSVAMVRRYIRDGSLFRENAAAAVGL